MILATFNPPNYSHIMRLTFLSLFLLLLAIACQRKITDQLPKNIQVTWGVITNFHQQKARFLAELNIINQSDEILQNNWELYFSYLPSRTIDTSNFSKEFTLTHINGDLHKLAPTTHYKPRGKGDTITLSLLATTWAIKESDTPAGFYFVFNKDPQNILQPDVVLQPFTHARQLTRTDADRVPVPSAENIYAQNLRLNLLAKNQLTPITPTPQFIQYTQGFFPLDQSTTIVYEKEFFNEAQQLQAGIKDFTNLTLQTTLDESSKAPAIVLKKAAEIASPEGYKLKVSSSKIMIVASSAKGMFYGVQSLKALLPIPTNKDLKVCKVPLLEVKDQPRFAYRGMHVDVARNFQSKQSILKLLDLMGFYKLNKLHFHLTDDEGWRIAIDGLPELTEIGAKRIHTLDESQGLIHQYGSASSNTGSGYYSQEDFIEILKFATQRHIEVIPEIDMPGHARAAIVAMKARQQKYLAQNKPDKANEYLLHDPQDQSIYRSVQNFNDNVICPCQPGSERFLDKVITSIVQMYQKAKAPLGTIHTGGDEVPHGVWEKSPRCQQLINTAGNGIAHIQDIKNHFIKRLVNLVSSKGLKTAGWEEIALKLRKVDGQAQEVKTVNRQLLDKNLQPYVWNSVYGWGGEEIGYRLANAGYPVVLSNVNHLYFDLAYNKNPKEPGFYWGGFVNDETPYLFQPFNIYQSLKTDLNGQPIPQDSLAKKVKLNNTGQQNILGIQGQLWSETIKTAQRFEYMLLPRLISLAERAWTSQPSWGNQPTLYKQAWNEFANRLGQRELVRMDRWHGGINYHIPTPGALIKNDTLYANVGLPGFQIRYSTNGSLPTAQSPVYTQPVALANIDKKKVILKAFNTTGRSGLAIIIKTSNP